MPYVRIPKDLTSFKPKVIGGLTARQLVCWGGALIIGFPTYLLISKLFNSDIASWVLIILVTPLFMFGVVEKNGLPLEKFLLLIIRTRIIAPFKRPYKTKNFYETLQTLERKETD